MSNDRDKGDSAQHLAELEKLSEQARAKRQERKGLIKMEIEKENAIRVAMEAQKKKSSVSSPGSLTTSASARPSLSSQNNLLQSPTEGHRLSMSQSRGSVIFGEARDSLRVLSHLSPVYRKSIQLPKLGVQLRAEAVKEGLPPMAAVSAQVFTRIYENTRTYRTGGDIPGGLYFGLLDGTAEPKNFYNKAKSAQKGLGAGNAPLDPRNGRRDKNKMTGEFEFKNRVESTEGVEVSQKRVILRELFHEIGINYELLKGDELKGETNPDKNGLLRYKLINDPDPYMGKIVYSVMTTGAGAEPIKDEILHKFKLISDHLKYVGKEPDSSSPFSRLNLDTICQAYVKHPDDVKEEPFMIRDNIVRDNDEDNTTDPSSKAMAKLFGEGDYSAFLQPLDMSSHHLPSNPALTPEEQEEAQLTEDIRANTAKDDMLSMLCDLNQKKWDHYDGMKVTAQKDLGRSFTSDELKSWEIDNVNFRPFIPKLGEGSEAIGAMRNMANVVGKGPPIQVFMSLENNFFQQKLLAATLNIYDFDDPKKRNSAIVAVHEQSIDYEKKRALGQHPGENFNEDKNYASPRARVVIVKGDNIMTGVDKDISELALKNKEYLHINIQWIGEGSAANENAGVWVKHFLAQSDTHYSQAPSNVHYQENVELAAVVNSFLENPKNEDFVVGLLKDLKIEAEHQSLKTGTKASQDYLDRFLENRPEMKDSIAKKIESEPEPEHVSSITNRG